jgi:hypothetical protein
MVRYPMAKSSHPQITTAQLRELKCKHCDGAFVTECAPEGGWADDAVPYINRGLMEVRNKDGSIDYYHGYQGRGCFAEAIDGREFLLGDKQAEDAMGVAVETALKAWFKEWGPNRATLTNISYKVTFNWREGSLKFTDE